MKKSMATIGLAVAVWLVGSVAWAQCCPGSKAKAKAAAENCPKCGEVAKSADCCKADAELCPACGLHKGSPGCGAKCAPPAEPAS